MDDIRPRCGWCNLSNPVYVAYHDAEWAVPSHDDHHLFEMLVLETFQAGLSWETILNKRKRFRQAFEGFDIERIRRYDEKQDRRTHERSGHHPQPSQNRRDGR